MADLLYLSRADVERVLDIDLMLDALSNALVAFSAGRASAPPRVGVRVGERGLLGVMPGYLPDVALEAKLVSVFPENDARGVPSHQGLIALFDEKDGAPVALMDGTYITAIRTGGTAAVATRVLARQDAKVLAILGAGAQGRSHLATFPRARGFEEIRIANRNHERARELAAREPMARAVSSFEEAVRGADVVACCTDSRQPILRREWLRPGAHVSAVGGTFGPELDAETVAGCRAHELQGLDPQSVTEVGEVIAKTRPGRRSAEEITLYKSTGHAVEDAATARLVYDRALTMGVGIRLAL